MLPNEVRVIATDPGTVNHALCHLAFSGYRYETNKSGQLVKMPQIRILNWELWDLKRKLRYSANNKFGVVTNRYGESNKNAPNDSYVSLSENMAHFVADSPWMFDTYRSALYGDDEVGEQCVPAIVTELQCGVIKNGELEVVLMSYELPTCVKALDIALHQRLDRQIVSRARKYGIPSDGALTYKERKAKSDEVGHSLLRMLGLHGWLDYIDNLLKARKRDVPHKPPQSHDMMDSLLLAVASCDELYHGLLALLESDAKNGNENAQRLLFAIKEMVANLPAMTKPSTIQIEIDDDEDDPKTPTKKKKKTTKPVKEDKKKSDLRKRADAVHESFVTHDKEKKRRREAQELKVDLDSLLHDTSDEETDKQPPKRRKTTKSSKAAKKYTQLTLCTV